MLKIYNIIKERILYHIIYTDIFNMAYDRKVFKTELDTSINKLFANWGIYYYYKYYENDLDNTTIYYEKLKNIMYNLSNMNIKSCGHEEKYHIIEYSIHKNCINDFDYLKYLLILTFCDYNIDLNMRVITEICNEFLADLNEIMQMLSYSSYEYINTKNEKVKYENLNLSNKMFKYLDTL